MTTPAGGVPPIPDYFALFQSMLNPAAANPAAAPSMFAMLDPKEIERKISELETVLTWLKGTVGMVELSLQTLKYQQSVLASLGEASKNAQTDAGGAGPNLEALAKSASAMNPALWAWNMMQSPAATSAEPSVSKSGAKKKTAVRKPR
jgi:hypothetical protein